MAKNKNQETELPGIDLLEAKSSFEEFVENNGKWLALGAIVIVLGVVGFYYMNYVSLPQQEAEAQSEMFVAQMNFEKDSFNLALNGDGGFLDIIENYGRTKSANLANYYAGISYLNLGQFEDALEYLGNFSGDDLILSAMAKGAMGDAHMELGDTDKGIKMYKDAASTNPNDLSSPFFMYKAGLALEKQGSFAEAKKVFENLKQQFPNSLQGRDAEKYIARVEAKL